MKLLADHALLPNGWAEHVLIDIDASGAIVAVASASSTTFDAQRIKGFVIPGMPNLHSHAFQRAMAGLNERRSGARDSFWTWREMMYRFAANITADQMQAIATDLYVEMLKAGFTSVAEFHYLHHDRGGVAYADSAEMSQRLIAAAADAGIAITLLPVLYAHNGFGGQPPRTGQARFIHSTTAFTALVELLHASARGNADMRIGAAFHSLRAVEPSMIARVIEVMNRIDATAPIHIHIAEQTQEVDECLQWSAKRPVEWLLDNVALDERWCLVHATHVNEVETARLADSGAIAGLCPTTEANLGDGIFPAPRYFAANGRIGIGTDSHVSVSVIEELRTLEYGQRLTLQQRAVMADVDTPSPAQRMYEAALDGGAHALGRMTGRIAVGHRADLVVLDAEHKTFWNATAATVMDAWVFAGDRACVRDAMVSGRWCIRDGRHVREREIANACRAAQLVLNASA